ncbi:MAG: hypothetical protein ABSD44_02370 [Terracidiphilus sp.]
MRIPFSRRVWKGLGITSGAFVSVFLLYSFINRSHSVLYHIDGDCACTDYSYQVEGFSLFNPFRSRAPERAVNRFLKDYRNGKISTYAVPEIANSMGTGKSDIRWVLEGREDHGNSVQLFYDFGTQKTWYFTEYGSEGMIQVSLLDGKWKVDQFDVTW